jgi:hypothetical protein
VATYALGLVYHLLGCEIDALKWYDGSTELLIMAKTHWATVNALRRVDACSRLERWVEILSDCLTRRLTHSEMESSRDVWAPVVLAERRGCCVEQVEVYKLHGELRGQINRFRVYPLEEGWSVRPAPGSRYGAQEIPEKLRPVFRATRGDHVLIQWDEPLAQQDRARMEELGRSEDLSFLRGADGRIYIVGRTPLIIGGAKPDSQTRFGRIPALLVPTTSPDTPTSSPEEPPPSSEPS